MAEIQIDATDLERSLDREFARLAEQRAVEARIALPPELHPNHRLATALRNRLVDVPSLRRVVLEHPSPAIRFLASSLSLLMPQVQFDVVTGTPSRSQDAPGEPVVPHASAVIEAEVSGDEHMDQQIAAAFDKATSSRATSIVLVFDPRAPIQRGIVSLIAEQMQAMLSLRLLVLVHPGPAAGFLASTLGLRCPRARVIACANSSEAQRALRARA